MKRISRRTLLIKLSMSAILIGLYIVFTKLLSIQNIPFIPFARISLGPSLIIFASIFLGPFWGLAIGIFSDLLGMLINFSPLAFNPGITLMYGLLGFVSYFIYKGIKSFRDKKVSFVLFSGLLLCFLFILSVNIAKTEAIGQFAGFEWWLKLIIISALVLLAVGTILFVYFYEHKQKKEKQRIANLMPIAFTALIVEIFIMLLYGSFIKSIYFGFDIHVVFYTQTIILFIDIVINTVVVTLLTNLPPLRKLYNSLESTAAPENKV